LKETRRDRGVYRDDRNLGADMTATRSLSASVQLFGRILMAADAGCPDADLVRRFAERRDEGAFAALVQRHAGAVFGVCRRVLRHQQDAEDAFQATFLVLARNAGTVREAGAVGSWLYGVAYNVARKAKAARHRREAKELEAAARQRPDTPVREPDDWRPILDVELAALPEKYRAAVVLCDLMGLTAEAAAAEVGCPAKTLGTRLSRGRVRLAARLARRGVALPAGALALEFSRCAAAGAPTRLVGPAVHAALGFASGSAAVPSAVAALTEGVTNAMLLKTPKYAALLACAALAVGGLTRHVAPVREEPAPGVRAASKSPSPARPRELQSGGFLDHVHRVFIAHLRALVGVAPGGREASDDKTDAGGKDKDKKASAPSGSWVRKEGELKVEFADKGVLKIYPHGENEVIVISCEYTAEKEGRVKAKITGLEGKEEATKKAKERVPVGAEFSFLWKAKEGAAKLSDMKGDKAEHLKSHLEGDYVKKE
jgi:RNA polymerase sigma factor (sigma-70 family)